MSTYQIEDTERVELTICKHQWWNLVHVICCMKCGEGK